MLTRIALRTLEPLPDFPMSVSGMQLPLRKVQRRRIIFMLRRNRELRSPRVVTLKSCFVIVLDLHDTHIYLKGADFKALGFSDGCPKCDHARRSGPGRTTAPHSEQCRQRVMIELMKTPEGIARVNQALNRGERIIA